LEIKEKKDELKKRLEKLRNEQFDYMGVPNKEEGLEEIKKIINKLDFLFLDGDKEKILKYIEDKRR
jgi:hypothetical protein